MKDTKMKLTRKVKSDNFTIVDNTFLRRNDMTARSKGLLTYILSLPDDWLVYKKEIFRHHKEGYDALNTAFNELEELGYINHYSIRNEKGRIERWNCEIYEDPNENHLFQNKRSPVLDFPELDNPELGSPKLDKPEQGNPELLSTNSTNNLLNKELTKLIDDDDINKNLNKILTQNIIENLKSAGIQNLTATKLIPLARSMYKFIVVHNQEHEEVEKIILLATELYELNNGRSINYLIALLKDWEERELYDVESIRSYIAAYKNKNLTENIGEPVPMINWLEESKN